jgi:hypothetical protein
LLPQADNTGKEDDMWVSLHILVGLVVGYEGFALLAEHALPGCAALMVSGFLILTAVDELYRAKGETGR